MSKHAIKFGLAVLWMALLMLAAQPAAGQTNLLYGYVGDYGVAGQSNVTVTARLLYPPIRTSGDILVRKDLVTSLSVSNGYFDFTNFLWGKYTFTVDGTEQTPFTAWVTTNTLGRVPIASLVTNLNIYPPNPATNYYTVAQVDALIAANIGGGGSGTTQVYFYTNAPPTFGPTVTNSPALAYNAFGTNGVYVWTPATATWK